MSQAVATIGADDERLEHAIIRAAQDDTIDITKLQALLDMQRQVAQDRSKRMFNSAMADAQAEMLPVIRDATNAHTKSKYARLETIDGQMRPIYTAHGFSVRYGSQPCPREGWMRITITISHSGGHWEENYLDAPPDDVGARGNVNKTPIMSVGRLGHVSARQVFALHEPSITSSPTTSRPMMTGRAADRPGARGTRRNPIRWKN